MARKKISQNRARSLEHEVAHLKERDRVSRCAYAKEYPGGVHIATLNLLPEDYAKIQTARRLGFANVCTSVNRNELLIYALEQK
jgi:hypothetical protein